MARVNYAIPSKMQIYYQIDFTAVCFNALFNNLVAEFSRISAVVPLNFRNVSVAVGGRISNRPTFFSHSMFLLIGLLIDSRFLLIDSSGSR